MENNRPTEWLKARQAIELVIEHNSINGAGAAICQRAFVGLVSSSAVLLRKPVSLAYGGSKPLDYKNVEIPKIFWGHISTVKSDWSAGDFTAWMDSGDRWEAYGVEFDALGIYAMLGLESTTGEIEEQANEALPAKSALSLPPDDVIAAKMLELYNMGVCRDDAAKLIRQLVGFELVGNEHARRVANGALPVGRRKKGA